MVYLVIAVYIRVDGTIDDILDILCCIQNQVLCIHCSYTDKGISMYYMYYVYISVKHIEKSTLIRRNVKCLKTQYEKDNMGYMVIDKDEKRI